MLYDTIWYDTMTEDMTEEFNVDSKLSDQINLAHVTRKKYKKEETKTNKRQCKLSPVQAQEGSPEGCLYGHYAFKSF